MTMRLDEERLYRDELAERRRERDREREPRRFYRAPALLLERARRVSVNPPAAVLECPACLSPVFALAGDGGERVDCAGCDARLVTHRSASGELTAILVEGTS